MEINEINSVSTNNIATTSLDVTNFKTSDELAVGENNVTFGESSYAKRKRAAKATSTIFTLIVISVTTLSAGGIVINSFLGSDPVIASFDDSYSLEGNVFSYKFDITIESSILLMDLQIKNNLIEEIKFESTGVYEGSLELEEKTTYNVVFKSSNRFDYVKVLSNYSIILEVS